MLDRRSESERWKKRRLMCSRLKRPCVYTARMIALSLGVGSIRQQCGRFPVEDLHLGIRRNPTPPPFLVEEPGFHLRAGPGVLAAAEGRHLLPATLGPC